MHAEKGDGLKRVFLHIGQPKTATTTIQSFLNINQAELIKHGWLYPNAGRAHLAQHVFGNLFREKKVAWIDTADPRKLRADLNREVEKTGCENIIISTESLYFTRNPAAFAQFFKDFDTKVIIFLRRQDEWIESAYRENRKNIDITSNPERFLNFQKFALNYANIIDSWATAFGKENIIINVIDSAEKRLPIEKTFMNLVGAPFTKDMKIPAAENERLNRDCIEFLSNFSDNLRVGRKYEIIKRGLINYSGKHPDAVEFRNIYPPQIRQKIVENYSESNAYVAQTYLGRQDGKLFTSAVPTDSDPWQLYPGLSAQGAVAIAEFLMSHMFNMVSSKK